MTEQVFEFIEPWKCEGPCGAFIYNKLDGYPAPGAPVGFQINPDGKSLRVCATCADMYIVLMESNYMRSQHSMWMTEQEHKIDKLKSGGNYLS